MGTNIVERQLNEGPQSPKEERSASYPQILVGKNHNKMSLEGRFQNKFQTPIGGPKKTETGRIIQRLFISNPVFHTDRRNQ